LTCGIVGEEDVLDLYEEAEFETDKAVSMEIKGWMANIQMDILDTHLEGASRDDGALERNLIRIGSPSCTARRSPNMSVEEERLMQQILEDECET
jgi:hypothetical protein